MSTADSTHLRVAIPDVVRRNTILLAVAQCVGWIAIQMVIVLSGAATARLTGDVRWTGVPLTLIILVGALTAPYAGRIMDRLGRRTPLVLGQILMALGSLLAGISIIGGSFAGFLAGITLLGTGTGTTALSRSAAADMYPPATRSEGLSLVVMGGAVGAIGGPFLLSAVMAWAEAISLDPLIVPWLAMPALALPGLLGLLWLRPDPKEIGSNLEHYYPGDALPQAREEHHHARPISSIVSQYPVVVAIAATGLLQAGMVMFMVATPVTLTQHGHGDALSAVISGHFFGMLGLSLFIGRLADRLGRRTILIGGALTFMVGALVTPILQKPLYSGVGMFLVGLGWSLCFVAGNTVLADQTGPSERGRTLGANDLLVGVASATAAFIAGLLLAETAYAWLVALSLALAAVPLALALRLREPQPGRYA